MEIDPTPLEAAPVQGRPQVSRMARPEEIAISGPEKFDGDSRKGMDIQLWLRGLKR